MFDKKEIPGGQMWLIKRMQMLGYKTSAAGICYGVAQMSRQALHLGELEHFNQRLQLINAIPPEQFVEYIEHLKAKRRDLISIVKADSSKEYDRLNINEKEVFENDPATKEKLETLKIQPNTNETPAEFTKRKEVFLRNIYIQNKINKALDQLPIEEKLALEIPAFFEGIEVYHSSHKYPELYGEGAKYKLQDIASSMPLVLPDALEQQGGIMELTSFSGGYDKNSLTAYLDSFRNAVEQTTPPLKQPISLILRSCNHAINLTYDPKANQWLLIDANDMESATKGFKNSAEMAEKIVSSFSTNNFTAFSTEIYGPPSDAPTLNNLIQNWKKQEEFQAIHTPSSEKAQATDSYGSSWLNIAAGIGNIDEVNALVKQEIFIDFFESMTNPRRAPLFVAAQRGSLECVNALLENGANPDEAYVLRAPENHPGFTPLFVATQGGHFDIVKTLLERGANVNYPENGPSPLYIAANNGSIELVNLLLSKGANANCSFPGGSSPLFVAAQNGHLDIVKTLLKHNEGKTEQPAPFEGTAVGLIKFAKENGVEQAMQDFLDKTISKVTIKYLLHQRK